MNELRWIFDARGNQIHSLAFVSAIRLIHSETEEALGNPDWIITAEANGTPAPLLRANEEQSREQFDLLARKLGAAPIQHYFVSDGWILSADRNALINISHVYRFTIEESFLLKVVGRMPWVILAWAAGTSTCILQTNSEEEAKVQYSRLGTNVGAMAILNEVAERREPCEPT
jgi:hypothetical protein